MFESLGVILGTVIGAKSVDFLIEDYQDRRDFNHFVRTNNPIKNGFQLHDNVLASSEPLTNPTDSSNKFAIIQSKHQVKSYHTFYNDHEVRVGNTKITVPLPETYHQWVRNSSTTRVYAPALMFGGLDIQTYPNTLIHWTSKYTVSNDNTRIKCSALINNQIYTAFAYKPNPETIMVKYLGTRDQVLNDIRSQEFDIDNGKTAFISIVGLGSMAFAGFCASVAIDSMRK